MPGCHFWANVMLRQSRLRASRASPAQKSQGLRVVCSKNFSRATFFVFWSTQMVDICKFELSDLETNLMKKRSVNLSHFQIVSKDLAILKNLVFLSIRHSRTEFLQIAQILINADTLVIVPSAGSTI